MVTLPGSIRARFPLRFAEAEAFAAARALLAGAGYTENAVRARLGIENYQQFKSPRQGRERALALEKPVDVLIRLMLDEEYVPVAKVRELLPPGTLETFDELGLVGRDAAWPEKCFTTAMLYPTRGLYVCSDRATNPDSSPYSLPVDVVYPAIGENTTRFMSSLPDSPCDAFLDIGAGTGIAALWAASRFARHAWAVDIAERSVEFAEFNRRLNGLDNVTNAAGDLYHPVEGRTFDRIVAHPPYVPVRTATYIFRDGGEDGEQILRRIVEGLPEYLRPGGTFYCVTLGSDREGEPFEERIRKWLGEHQGSFDVVLAAVSNRSTDDFIAQSVATGSDTRVDEVRYWRELFAKLKTQWMFYGSVAIRRHDDSRTPFTARVHRGRRSAAGETEWLLGWGAAASHPNFDRRLMDERPALSPHLELRVVHRMHSGELKADEFGLAVNQPFESECTCQPWIVKLVTSSDGRRKAAEVYEALRTEGALPERTSPADFARVLRTMIASGFLEIESFPHPK